MSSKEDKFYTRIIGSESFTVLKRYSLDPTIPHPENKSNVCPAIDQNATDIRNKRVCITKITFESNDNQNETTKAKSAFREFNIMKSLTHPNVVWLLNAFTPQNDAENFNELYLVTELMDSTLRDLIGQQMKISSVLSQILCGLKYLHACKIVHRNLKPDNIYIRFSDGAVKIGDFDNSRVISNNASLTRGVVTRYYRPPEILLGLDYDHKVDIWSLGCIFGELIKQEILFRGNTNTDMWMKIVQMLGTPDSELMDRFCSLGMSQTMRENLDKQPKRQSCSFVDIFPDENFPLDYDAATRDSARDLLSKMLVIDPQKRFSVNEAILHPFIMDRVVFIKRLKVGANTPYPSDLEKERSTEEWKKFLFNGVSDYMASPIE